MHVLQKLFYRNYVQLSDVIADQKGLKSSISKTLNAEILRDYLMYHLNNIICVVMKILQACLLNNVSSKSTVGEIADALDACTAQLIETVPWKIYPYKPEVSFVIAHDNKRIFIKYFVKEHAIRAANANTNEPVYQDSCVEFFVAFNGDRSYYNFEFNCIGTCLSAFGEDMENRIFLSKETIDKIKYHVVLKKEDASASQHFNWELTLVIPLDVFTFHQLDSLKGINCNSNFFKCGDRLPQPHYLSWSPITSPSPNFHLPEFFGKLQFV